MYLSQCTRQKYASNKDDDFKTKDFIKSNLLTTGGIFGGLTLGKILAAQHEAKYPYLWGLGGAAAGGLLGIILATNSLDEPNLTTEEKYKKWHDKYFMHGPMKY